MPSASALLPRFSPETSLLCHCIRSRFNAAPPGEIRQLLQSGLDANRLLWEARWHRLTPLLYWNLKAIGPVRLPADTMSSLQTCYHANTRYGLLLSAELLKLLNALEARGLAGVPVRGPGLAEQIYGTLGRRQLNNLDLLVRAQDLAALDRIIANASYEALDAPGSFRHSAHRFSLQLHYAPPATPHFSPAAATRLWQRLEPASLFKKDCLGLKPEDQLLFLCAIGAQRLWQRLDLVCDLVQLVHCYKTLDWAFALSEAKTLKCESALLGGLALAQSLADLPLPEPVRQRLHRQRTLSRKLNQTIDRLIRRPHHPPGFIDRTFPVWGFHAEGWNRWQGLISSGGRLLRHIPTRAKRFLMRQRDFGEYLPTPQQTVERIIDLAAVQPEDILYDLGCGDGRIVIAAARRGLQAVGVDHDPARIAAARENARKAGVEQRVQFIRRHATAVSLTDATVVVSYLRTYGNRKLLPRLRRELRPGARIITRDFSFGDWLPHKTIVLPQGPARISYLYLWHIEGP